MIKLIVSDFDGTLLPYGEKRLSDTTVSYIKALISKGVNFAVASGRTYSELYSLMGDVRDDVIYIANDGAVIIRGEKVIFSKPFTRKSLSFFFDEDLFKNATLYSLDFAYIVGNDNRPVLYGKTPKRISRLVEVVDDVYKVSANAKTFLLKNTKDFRVHYSEGTFVEFVSPFANKGVALADLQLHLGVSKFDTASIGDADNDIPMTQHSHFSYSVGERSPLLKKSSKKNVETAQLALKELLETVK